MKITIIATSGFYPIHIGGPASVGYFLAKEFGESGHHTTVFVRVKNVQEMSLVQKLPDSAGLININIFPILIDYNLKTLLNFPYLLLKMLRVGYEFIKISSDVVLYNSPPVDVTLFIPLISRILSINQYMILHGGLFNESKNIFGRFIIKSQKSFFTKIVAVSSYSRDLAKKIGVNENKVVVINNGVDLSIYDHNLLKFDLVGSPKILYVGRIEKIKGVDILIKSFKMISDKLSNSHLYIVGEGSEKNSCIELVKKLELEQYIHFVGYVPPSETLYRYFRSCDMLILPSYIENFPLTLLEAMYLKIPIITTNIKGGVTELIQEGVNGFLIEPGNSEELAKRIIELYSKKEVQNMFIEYNYSLVCRKYTCSYIAKKYLSLFEEI